MSSLRKKYATADEEAAKIDAPSGGPYYFGYPAQKNSADDAAEWAIERITVSGDVYTVGYWANSSKAKVNKWSERESITTWGRVV